MSTLVLVNTPYNDQVDCSCYEDCRFCSLTVPRSAALSYVGDYGPVPSHERQSLANGSCGKSKKSQGYHLCGLSDRNTATLTGDSHVDQVVITKLGCLLLSPDLFRAPWGVLRFQPTCDAALVVVAFLGWTLVISACVWGDRCGSMSGGV